MRRVECVIHRCLGRMLRLAHTMLCDDGYLFIAVSMLSVASFSELTTSPMQLPLPCVTNSRYLTEDLFHELMEHLLFKRLNVRWKAGGKMAYWLYQKSRWTDLGRDIDTKFETKTVLRQGTNRNNFAILLYFGNCVIRLRLFLDQRQTEVCNLVFYHHSPGCFTSSVFTSHVKRRAGCLITSLFGNLIRWPKSFVGLSQFRSKLCLSGKPCTFISVDATHACGYAERLFDRHCLLDPSIPSQFEPWCCHLRRSYTV